LPLRLSDDRREHAPLARGRGGAEPGRRRAVDPRARKHDTEERACPSGGEPGVAAEQHRGVLADRRRHRRGEPGRDHGVPDKGGAAPARAVAGRLGTVRLGLSGAQARTSRDAMSGVATVAVETNAGQMPGHLWIPPGGGGPGLVLVQEIFGVSDYIRQRAADLSALGYVVLVPELYWRMESARIDESEPGYLQRALAQAQRLDWEQAVEDVRAAMRTLRTSPATTGTAGDPKVGLVGFCFGGGLAFNVAAVESPDVLVSYYGSALPHLLHLAPQ